MPNEWVKGLSGVVCLGLLLAACDDSLSLRFGERVVPHVPPPNRWEQSCDELGAPLIPRPPVADLSRVSVRPPGSPTPWTGVPTPGLIVIGEAPDQVNWTVLAPADGLLVTPASEAQALELRLCKEVTIRIEGVMPNPNVAGSEPTDAGGRFVHAGAPLAAVRDGHHFSYLMFDARVTTPGSHAVQSGFRDHFVCPLAPCDGKDDSCHVYFSEEQRAQWLAALQDRMGNPLSEEHACGIYPTERKGTALGVWNLPDAGSSDVAPLALSLDPSGAPYGIISNGRIQADANPLILTNVYQGYAWYRIADPPDGFHNDSLENVVPSPDGGPGPVHCYDSLTVETGSGAGSVVLLTMQDPDTLLAEAGQVPDCRSFVGADGGYVLPMNAAVRLTR